MGRGETTDQLRTTTAALSATQRSTMDNSDKWFTIDNHGHPIWGQRAMRSCAAATVMILPMTDLVPRQGRGLWVDSFWRSESIVTVLRPNSSGLRPIARYQLAQSQFVQRPAKASLSAAVMAPLASSVI
jgi:hypothetical protein